MHIYNKLIVWIFLISWYNIYQEGVKMKAIFETIFAITHLFFGIIALINSVVFIAIVSGIISVIFLILALKIAEYDIYVVKNENHTSTKI